MKRRERAAAYVMTGLFFGLFAALIWAGYAQFGWPSLLVSTPVAGLGVWSTWTTETETEEEHNS